MSSNFSIYSLKTKDSLHLKLTGDFDGNSAHELINILTGNAKDFYEIFIDTNELKSIHPFGIEVFRKNLGAHRIPSMKIVFIGDNGNQLATK